MSVYSSSFIWLLPNQLVKVNLLNYMFQRLCKGAQELGFKVSEIVYDDKDYRATRTIRCSEEEFNKLMELAGSRT